MLILSGKNEGRLFEMDDSGQFERSMDQVSGASVAVVIQGRTAGEWQDLEEFWSGPWRRDHPVPRQRDVAAVGLRAGVRQARYVVRSTI